MDPVLSRRSVRKYKAQPISEDQITTILQAAMSAPSADDERPWHFVIITDQNIKTRISELHPFAYFITHAPVAILICGDTSLQKIDGFWVQDCSAATENILIEAENLGLGAVWLGIHPVEGRVEMIRLLLDIPEGIIPFSLVAMGYPDEFKEPSNRYDISRIHYNGW